MWWADVGVRSGANYTLANVSLKNIAWLEIGEIQILQTQQNLGLGTQVLHDIIQRALWLKKRPKRKPGSALVSRT